MTTKPLTTQETETMTQIHAAPNNMTRADEAMDVLRELMQTEDDTETAMIDLLTNLRHLCRREHYNFQHALYWSRRHYHAEQQEEDRSP